MLSFHFLCLFIINGHPHSNDCPFLLGDNLLGGLFGPRIYSMPMMRMGSSLCLALEVKPVGNPRALVCR